MKRRHDREDIENELGRKAAAAAEGEVSERDLAAEDGAGAEGAAAPSAEAGPPAHGAGEPAKDRLIAELKDALLRQMADFDNFRRRTEKEKERIRLDAVADLVGAFLPVLDNLGRAAAVPLPSGSPDAVAVKEGLAQVLRQADEALVQLGVQEIPALGATFDPAVHHAVLHVEDDAAGAETVVEVYQKGYRCGERIVRHSMVKVAN